MEKSHERLYYADVLRIISAFFVIIGHVCVLSWEITPPNTLDWQIINVFRSIVSVSVPVFFMISGMLFLSQGSKLTVKVIYSKYILRLTVAYFCWAIIYAFISKDYTATGFILNITSGHYHMWFIPAIIGCYMVTPFLIKITESETLTKYFILLALAFYFVFSYICPILADSPVPTVSFLGENLTNLYSDLKIRMVLGYPSYFVIGFYLSKKDFIKRTRIILYTIGTIAMLFIIGMSSIMSLANEKPINTHYANHSIAVMLSSVAVFVFAKYNIFTEKPSLKSEKALIKASKYTFGVYLIHPIFINLIHNVFGITATTVSPIVTIPIFSATVFLLSFLASAVLNQIPVVKKYLV